MSSHEGDWHPNKKWEAQQEDLSQKGDSATQTAQQKPKRKTGPRKEDSLRKCLPNSKTDTRTANRTFNRNRCPRKEIYYENAFPTGRLTPKKQIINPTGRLAPERRLIKKMPSQQKGRHPYSKSQIQQEELPQEEVSLRKCPPNRKADTQTANHKPNRKACPRKKAH